ncbi:MAG: hypothetical protein AAF202_01430 [Pseudomonadota bacterium]
MLKTGIRLFLIAAAIVFAETSTAQDSCDYPHKGNENYHFGRSIVTVPDLKVRDSYRTTECSGGAAGLSACNSNAEGWPCIKSKMRMCNFCPQDTDQDIAYIERESGKELADFNSDCDVLRDTPPGFAKNRMSEEKFYEVKGRVTAGLQRAIDGLRYDFEKEVFNGITDDSGLTSSIPDTRFATQKSAYIRKIDDIFTGVGNPSSAFGEFGNSDTTLEIIDDLNDFTAVWRDRLKTDVTTLTGATRGMVARSLAELAGEIEAMKNYLDAEWNYTPQLACGYKDRLRR